MFFFFKQKTAYEMRISDWSSDVCSSDLPKGRRLVASHYGGVSLWWAKAEAQQPKRFSWKGSHVAVTWSGDGRFVITATQESELHGWRLAEGADMRMRSEERRVGEECGSTGGSRGGARHLKKKTTRKN